MDLDKAMETHGNWKIKFRHAINIGEALDASMMAKDNCCELGKWLYSEGLSKYGGKPEFQTLIDTHKAFHIQAGQIALLINENKFSEAEGALENDTPYSKASLEVGKAIFRLKKKISV